MSSPPPARIYVVDDNEQLRDGVTQWLKDAGFEARAFSSGGDLLAALPDLKPGCIVLDMLMPNMDGLEVQRRLAAASCHWPIIMLTGHANRPVVTGAVEAGFVAFLEKPVREAELLAAVLRAQAHLLGKEQMIPDPDLAHRLSRLTGREKQVLEYVLQKKLNKQIGAYLGIEETTVKGYRRGLMKKLGVHNTTELVVLAMRAGLYTAQKS
ncbi:MAG TPA: response regulator [Steroidobacteraceae bacterium]|nr:response regulator [Steroidobacteraceae bacterium]